MFERFTPSARAIVAEARSHAVRLGHRRIESEHLLLAMLVADGAVREVLASVGLTASACEVDLEAARAPFTIADRAALASLGIDLDRVVDSIEATHGRGALDVEADVPARSRRSRWRRRHQPRSTCPPAGCVPFSPRAKHCLELSLREALRLGHNFIAPEHLALGILREGQGLACWLLAERSIPFDAVRRSLEARLAPST